VGRLFGTDGVRGLANRDVTAELALDLSVAAAHILAEAGELRHDGSRPTAVVGRDPRASGEFLEAAVIAGLASAGIDVLRAGVVPTPAVSWLTADLGADLGVMLSASHNPMPDNGIKFFSRGGHKLADELEDRIEQRLREPWERPVGAAVGRITDLPDASDRYVEHLVSTLSGRLDGVRVVVDCANGAASIVGPAAYRAAGADVIEIHAAPDGLNINEDCGSTHLGDLQAAVIANGAHAGIAHDGDADRCLAVDGAGEVIDGDQILAVLALALRDSGELASNTVVTTVMANLGFRRAMQAANIEVVETAVGDRYVLEAMNEQGLVLGGEQSGHIIMGQHATTGDGVLTALHLLARLAATDGGSMAELVAVMTHVPQVLITVKGVDKGRVASDPTLQAAVAEAVAELGDSGRVLLRPSGTEAVVRVMVEAIDADQANAVANRLSEIVQSALAL
jgi:phosphoglucosamine mutase